MEVGVPWKWVKGDFLPPKDPEKWASGSAAEDVKVSLVLFADDTTLIGTKCELEEGKTAVKNALLEFEEKCHDGKEETIRFEDLVPPQEEITRVKTHQENADTDRRRMRRSLSAIPRRNTTMAPC